MAHKLVIVESPAKAKTIGKFLGRGYKVEASMGHVRDLPKSQIGVDVEHDFEPKYITIRGKGGLLDKIKKEAKKSDRIFLATDPDREGEAISWHLAHILHMDQNEVCRIEFNEITERAIKSAIKNPRKIDQYLVNAQQARRVLDRLVGYNISPLLWRKIRKGLSAGRVQSVAARIICDKEEEIRDFEPNEYWTITGTFMDSTHKQSFETKLFGTKQSKIDLHHQDVVQEIMQQMQNGDIAIVAKVKKGEKKRVAAPPFTTSSMQQEAARKLGFTTKKTMVIAQQLYEGIDIKGEGTIGLVSYIRTDSTRISSEAQQIALQYIEKQYGQKFIPQSPNEYKGRKHAQEAHEAIRPTSIDWNPERLKESLTKDQYKLYKLVYERFLSSQMVPALYDTLTLQIEKDEYVFKTTGSKLVFPGFTILYIEGRDDDNDEKEISLPLVEEGQELKLLSVIPEQHFTQPPSRYTEASLVKILEEKGIGRPSTYAPTISTILERGYIAKEGKTLLPTELGFIVTDLMKEFFKDIVDVQFTADMEEMLDEVEEGSKDWKTIIREFYDPFKDILLIADQKIEKIDIVDEVSDVVCEKCGALMVIKHGRYGKFLACPNFPDCRNTKAIVEELDAPCPKCGDKLVVRRSKKGGRNFYGCVRFPECDFVSQERPVLDKCSECGGYMVLKQDKQKNQFYQCVADGCKHKQAMEENNESKHES